MARPKRDVVKVTLYINSQDRDTLTKFFPTVGWTVAARRVISNFCEKLRAKEVTDERADDTR